MTGPAEPTGIDLLLADIDAAWTEADTHRAARRDRTGPRPQTPADAPAAESVTR